MRSRRKLQKFLREVSLADEIISKTTSKLDGTNKNETNTNLIQHDHRHRSVSVDGRLRHNKQHAEQREHACGLRL
jgi:hypothetical protein